MKNDDLFTTVLEPRGDDDRSQRHLPTNLVKEVIQLRIRQEFKDDLGMEPLSDPSEILTQKMGLNEQEKVAIKASMKPGLSQNPPMPNPSSKPTGFFLMGEGGGVDPH